MSESDSFIQEVSEEVRRERFARLLRRYGWIGALVLLALIGGAGLNEWRNARERAAAEVAGSALRDAFLLEEPAERAESLDAIADEVEKAEAIVRIAQAGALIEAEDIDAAGSLLAALSEDGDLSPVYRDLALLQRISALGGQLNRMERMAALETLARPDGPFRLLALEQRALARLEAGERDEARADLQAVLAEPGAPEGLASRARQLLVAAGGELPGARPAAAPGETTPPPDTASGSGANG